MSTVFEASFNEILHKISSGISSTWGMGLKTSANEEKTSETRLSRYARLDNCSIRALIEATTSTGLTDSQRVSRTTFHLAQTSRSSLNKILWFSTLIEIISGEHVLV